MNKSDLRDHKVYLNGVHPVRLNAKGEHFHVLEASSKVKLDFDGRVQYERIQGQGGDVPRGYNEVWLSSKVPQHVVVALGYGRVRDNTAAVNVANVEASIESANINNHIDSVDIAPNQTALLAHASVNRKELRVQVDSEQPSGVFVGGSGIANEQGALIEVGMVDYIQSKGAFYAHNPFSQNVKVRLLSLERA